MKKRLRIMKIIGVILLSVYLLLNAALFIFQDDLIYYPSPLSVGNIYEIGGTDADIERERIKMSDGTILKGWIVNKDCKNVVYYFGGNAEEVSDMLMQVKDIKDYAFVLINYRGYGDSEGEPSQKNLMNDAKEIYTYTQNKYGYSNIFLMGRSLGSGVALDLATKVHADGLILVTPYDSIENVAKNVVPPIFPVSLLLHEKYESIELAKDIHVPTLILMAGNDTVVPNKNTMALVKGFPETVFLIKIPNTGHNTISASDEYWPAIIEFLKQY